MDNIEQFKKKVEMIDNLVVKSDFEKFIKLIAEFMNSLKKANAETKEAMQITMQSALAKLEREQRDNLTETESKALDYCMREMRTMMAEHKSRMVEIGNKAEEIKNMMPNEAILAKTASDLAITEVLRQIPPKDDLKEEISKLGDLIVDTLSKQAGEEKLHIEDIWKLREELDELKKMKGKNFGGGGGLRPAPTGVETPTGDINGVNTAYTVTFVPQYITLQGQAIYPDNGYVLSSSSGILTITLDDAPLVGNILRSHY